MAISSIGLRAAKVLKSSTKSVYSNLGYATSATKKEVPDIFINSIKSIKSEQSDTSKILAKIKNFFSNKNKIKPEFSDIFKPSNAELTTDAQLLKFTTNPFSKNAQEVLIDNKKSKLADVLDDINIFKSPKAKKAAQKAKKATKKATKNVMKKSKKFLADTKKSIKINYKAANAKIKTTKIQLPFYISKFKKTVAKTFEEFKTKVDNSPAIKFAKSILKAEQKKTQRIVQEHYTKNKIDFDMRKKQYEEAKIILKEKITKFKDAIKNGDKKQILEAKNTLIQAQSTLKDAKAYLDIATKYLARAAKLAIEDLA